MHALASPVLLLGARGLVGSAWRARLERLGTPFDAPTRRELDFEKPEHLDSIARGPWRTVINCAAWANVDSAEAAENEAAAVNGHAPGRIAAACARSGARFLHYSTDYVFDGRARKPYSVGHVRAPINAYGRTKALGEELIETSGASWLIVRTSWVYSPASQGFLRSVARALREQPEVRMISDQLSRPTSVDHLVRTSARLLATNAQGIWHVTDGGVASRYDMACEIAAALPQGGAARVVPIPASEASRPAPRPAYSVLDIARTEARLGPMPDWRTLLREAAHNLTPHAPHA
ncbi:MAG: dTDP-4-dehydrorhamnose reductase [Planctomycetota bacterium]|nr:dTDP-4-dehydrorhamnose reductase [Planctomycetota bacterium]